MKHNFLHKPYEQIQIGDSYRSRARTITEADIVSWCALTGDWHMLHTNAHYAARSRFGQRIAPGLLVYAVGMGLAVPSDAEAIVANYGAERLRFTAPTLIGDSIHVQSEVRDKRSRREGSEGVVTMTWNVFNQNDALLVSSDLSILIGAGVRDGD